MSLIKLTKVTRDGQESKYLLNPTQVVDVIEDNRPDSPSRAMIKLADSTKGILYVKESVDEIAESLS